MAALGGSGSKPQQAGSSHSCPPNRLLLACLAVLRVQVREANQMVEEMMLLANCTGGLGGAYSRAAHAQASWAAALIRGCFHTQHVLGAASKALHPYFLPDSTRSLPLQWLSSHCGTSPPVRCCAGTPCRRRGSLSRCCVRRRRWVPASTPPPARYVWNRAGARIFRQQNGRAAGAPHNPPGAMQVHATNRPSPVRPAL